MRERVAAALVASLLVACAANGESTSITKDSPTATTTTSTSSSGGAGGSGGSTGGAPSTGGAGGDGGSQMGAPPIVVTANCDTDAGGQTWAIAQFPGKTRENLARVEGFISYDSDPSQTPDGFSSVAFDFVTVRDGEAAARCLPMAGASFTSATFVLPVP